MDIKKQELDLRKQEQEKMAIAQNQQTYMFNQMLKQQQEQHKQVHDMQSLLMQQQQLQTTAMMKIIETLVPKQTKSVFFKFLAVLQVSVYFVVI